MVVIALVVAVGVHLLLNLLALCQQQLSNLGYPLALLAYRLAGFFDATPRDF